MWYLKSGEFVLGDDYFEILKGEVGVNDDGNDVGEVAGELQHELLVLAVAPEANHVHVHCLVRQCVEHRFSALDHLRLRRDLLLSVQLVFEDHTRVRHLGLPLDYAEQWFVFHLLEWIVQLRLQVQIVRYNVHAFRRLVRRLWGKGLESLSIFFIFIYYF